KSLISTKMEVDNDASMVSDDTNAINNIAPDGDVIMVVGPKKKGFRLHSQILKAASKVFNAMLSPKFAEGQQLVNNSSQNDPVRINLPEDNAYSMGILFKLIYYRHDVFSGADGVTFLNIARAADKYDLIRAVKCPITEAMDDILFTDDERGEEESMWKLAIASSIFNYDCSFKKATQALVLLSSDGYIRLANLWYQDQIFALRLCGQSQWNSLEICNFANIKGISGLLEDQRAELRRLAMRKLMVVCGRYNDEDNDQTQRTSGSTILRFDIKRNEPEDFADSDLQGILDAIEYSDCFNQFRKKAKRKDDRSTKWIGDIVEKAGLYLSDLVLALATAFNFTLTTPSSLDCSRSSISTPSLLLRNFWHRHSNESLARQTKMEVDDDASMTQNNASTASDNASKITDVAADGDIIMIVGPDKRKFRVHSVMLKSASKVFKAMLGPNFAEGRRLRNNGHHGDITKIELPEDNDGGMSAIFHLLHHRVEKLPDPMPAAVFYQLGIAADKYDLVSTLKYTIIGAIYRAINDGRELKDMRMLDVWYLAITAACFDDAANFATLTHALVWYCDTHFVHLAEEAATDDSFAYRLCGLLEMKRSTIRSEMLHKILAGCSCKDEGRILTTIRWGYSDDDEYDMAKCMSRGSLHTMWKYIKNAEPNLEFMNDFDPDSPKCWSWIEGIRKDGKMLLKDTRKPQAENVVGTQRP
ncbi:BTB/POZ domain-containing protein, partial [Colletotrichum asianum]